MDEYKYLFCVLFFCERLMCFCVGGILFCNVYLKEILMEEFRVLLGICKCCIKVGFICIIFEIYINIFSKN